MLAYFDPGAGSIVLQALVGGSAGLWVAVRYWWRLPKAASEAKATERLDAQANIPSARLSRF